MVFAFGFGIEYDSNVEFDAVACDFNVGFDSEFNLSFDVGLRWEVHIGCDVGDRVVIASVEM